MSDLLDDAEILWPDIGDRKKLLLRLVKAGHDSLHMERAEAEAEAENRRERQRAALVGLQRTVDWDVIRGDQTWSR